MSTRRPLRTAFRVAALLVGGTIGSVVISTQAQNQIIWFADHEEPGESDWSCPGGLDFGGGEFDSGCVSPTGAGWLGTFVAKWDNDPTSPFPPAPPGGGNFGLAMVNANSCSDGQGAGTRMFRWANHPAIDDLYYRVWGPVSPALHADR